MGKYQGYEKYKDSGVNWLGNIPEHWEIKKIQYVGRLKSGENITSQQIHKEGLYPVFGGNGLRGYFDFYTHEGHYILIGRQGALCGNINYANGKFWASEHAVVVTCSTNFEVYWFGELLKTMNLNQYSTSAAQPGLSVEQISRLKIPFPPLDEQTAIARFLDYKTKQIDDLIAKKEALLEKLDEKRTALISHAVTKGLDPSVPMKDSGIEWLGEIPEHWNILSIKRFSEIYDCKHKTVSFVDDGLPVASIAQVQNFYIDLSTAKRTTKEEFIDMIEGGREPQYGDIIFSRNATVGASAIVRDDVFCMGQDVCLIRAIETDSIFLNYNFRSLFIKAQVDTCLLGSTFKRINVEEVKNLLVCFPPLEEQKLIFQHLVQKTAEIDQQKAKIQKAIELLKEYRTALITNAVTGKIDVRQVPIP
jgi:type I restriction enzyme S subunit